MQLSKDDLPIALVAGATGIAGTAISQYLSTLGKFRILALSRNSTFDTNSKLNLKSLKIDLLDKNQIQQKLTEYPVTHLYYAAQFRPAIQQKSFFERNIQTLKVLINIAGRISLGNWVEKIPALRRYYYQQLSRAAGLYDPEKYNLRMLDNLVEVVSQPPHRLEHICIVTGGRYHGMHLGPKFYPDWKTPFKEDAERHPGPSWYFDLEDYLKENKRKWSWSVARPSFIIGYPPLAPQNFGTGIGVYASILKELGYPLIFPGGKQVYECLWQVSSAAVLGEVMYRSTTVPGARNGAFNAVNKDIFRWSDIWPVFGDYFQMDITVPKNGISIYGLLCDKGKFWDEMVKKYNLKSNKIEAILPMSFLDQSMLIDWDINFSLEKLYRLLDPKQKETTLQVFLALFDRMRGERIIPA